ncbi:hypothetical protein [Aurantibacillus circumpalustris]|uniref:hypothetical protein n=1 Tax=Aurantibacillus circumpalustris TaxID=3036359 RepID=UPI00295B2958|nr:hypothetical protein [Aurantibacillus circumpalustris]
MNLLQRAQSPTPKFFRIMRAVGLSLAAVGGTIISAPILLPITVITIGGYMVVAGSVATAVSQFAVKSDK